MQYLSLQSFDGQNIFCTIWDDVHGAKGVIQLVHGMGEYAGHYDEFAKYLNSRGYIVFADDHRAHGRTETDKNRGNHKGDIFAKTLKDELFFRDWLKAKYNLPVFLMGHSYGSFLAQAFAQAGTDVKAIALLGTGYIKKLPALGVCLLAPVQLFARNKRVSFFTNNPNKPSKEFPGETGPSLWLNSIPERRLEIVNDKYCHVRMSINFQYSFMKHLSHLYDKHALSKLNPTTAIGIFGGECDKLGAMGEGVQKLNEMYIAHGVKSELHLYKGARHEAFYDICAERFQSDVADFFDRFVIYHQTSLDELI